MEEQEDKKIIIETYENDLANSMDATDALVVQKLFEESKRKVEDEQYQKKEKFQKSFLKSFGILFLIISLGAIGYSVWHYNKLTVPIVVGPNIGVFNQTEQINTSTTDIVSLLKQLDARKDFSQNIPYLTDLVSNTSGGSLISSLDTLDFLQTNSDEPFNNTFMVIRLGVINLADGVHPFVIGYVKDPVIANKEFLLNEPKMTSIFEKSLEINLSNQNDIIGGGFNQDTLFNLSMRILKSDKTDPKKITMLYGYVAPNTVVFATNPDILRAVYETLITQNTN